VEAVQGVADVVAGADVVARSRVLGVVTVDCMHTFVRIRIRLGPGRSNLFGLAQHATHSPCRSYQGTLKASKDLFPCRVLSPIRTPFGVTGMDKGSKGRTSPNTKGLLELVRTKIIPDIRGMIYFCRKALWH
jgi:hypothetical protein